MTTAAPVLCRSCARPRDLLGRCWKCDTWLCACGKPTATALRSVCNVCDLLPDPNTVEVEQPDGSLALYRIRELAPGETHDHEWRAWVLTSPAGTESRVSELLNNRWACDCKAQQIDRHGAGRRFEVDGVPCCKHIAPVAKERA